jgi:hypothetical protein
MEHIRIPEHLDPGSRIGDAESEDHSAKKELSRRKRPKAQAPVTPEESTADDDSHQLDELA